MHTLNDLLEFRDGSYGLNATNTLFRGHTTPHFYGSDTEWNGLKRQLDSKAKKYGTPEKLDIRFFQRTSVIAAYRHAFADVLTTKPQDIQQCQETLDDAVTTLNTIVALNDVTPFLHNEPYSAVCTKLRHGDISDEHVACGSMSAVDLEKECVGHWNKRRAAKYKRPLMPYDEQAIRCMVLGRNDIESRRIFTEGDDDEVLGYYVLRTPYEPDARGVQLIAWGAENIPGFPDCLASLLLFELKNKTCKRIENLLEESH